MNRTQSKFKHSCKLSAAKKLFFLLFAACSVFAAHAQNCVSVKSMSANYATKTVTFTLAWSGCNGTNHLNKAWVFVDYQPVTGLTKGDWAPAAIAGAATVSNGTYTAGNTRGFYVTGSNGSIATVTVSLSGVPDQFNWCVYATDYPPNAVIIAGGGYTLRGTPPFTVNGAQLGNGIRGLAAGTCVTSYATGCPGLLSAAPAVTTTNPDAVNAGNGVTLTATPSGGTTTTNTYTWNIGGATTTTTTNTFAVPAASITTSKTFTVSVTNANNCNSAVASGTITVNSCNTSHVNSCAGCSTFCGKGYKYYHAYISRGYCECSNATNWIGTTQVATYICYWSGCGWTKDCLSHISHCHASLNSVNCKNLCY